MSILLPLIDICRMLSGAAARNHKQLLTKTRSRALGVMVGPFLSVGVPHPLNLGMEARNEQVQGNVGLGTYTYKGADSSTIQDLKVSIQHIEAGGLWFPFKGSYFLGGELGHQLLQVSAKSTRKLSTAGDSSSDLVINADLKIETIYLTPQTGWLFTTKSGFNIGTVLGVQYPLNSRSTFAANIEGVAGLDEAVKSLPEYQQFDEDVNDAGRKAGLLAIPKWEIIRVGWLF